MVKHSTPDKTLFQHQIYQVVRSGIMTFVNHLRDGGCHQPFRDFSVLPGRNGPGQVILG